MICVGRMRPNIGPLDRVNMTTTILAAIGAAVLILNAATRLPTALAELLRSLHLVRDALRELRSPLSGSADKPAESGRSGCDQPKQRR